MHTRTASGFDVGTGSDFKYGCKLPAAKSRANFSKFSTLFTKLINLIRIRRIYNSESNKLKILTNIHRQI